MATKPNPFAKFEKSGKDKEVAGKGKEGSKREEKFDKTQVPMFQKGKAPVFKKGGKC